jgi:hypothetical protein
VVLKVAVTFCAEFIVTEQLLVVPEQAPPQDTKVEPLVAVAVKVMEVPAFDVDEQVEPQEIEPPETVPEPVPDLLTDKV